MTMLGNFAGAAVIPLSLASIGGVVGAYWVIIVVMLLGMAVTVLSVKEPPVSQAPPPFHWREFVRGLYEPLQRSHDFRWVFWTRFLVTMGIFTVQQFLLFYFIDVVKAFRFFGSASFLGLITLNSATDAASVFFLMLLVGAIVSSLIAGLLSDKYGRKLMVYISGALQGLVAGVFIFFGDYTLAVLMGLVFGLGYGAYQAVDWALAADVLPSMDDYAKDMGVWHIALTFPQVIATPIAGFLLDMFQGIGKTNGWPTLGYTVIFALAVVYFALGTYFVKRIRAVK
jgi:MFS family permease